MLEKIDALSNPIPFVPLLETFNTRLKLPTLFLPIHNVFPHFHF